MIVGRRLVIHVIGDCMIDQYYRVNVTRISPESLNVCVMVSPDDQPEFTLPGGAANVCHQLSKLNVEAKLFSIDGHFTPMKKRFFCRGVQVGNRWDIEQPNYGFTGDELKIRQNKLNDTIKRQTRPDVIILSDYNKGVFKDYCYELPAGVPTIVDPKKAPLDKWHGCTVFKPNAVEAVELSDGLQDWRRQCDYFRRKLDCKSVVITREGDGVVGFDNDYFEYWPAKSVHATCTIGAGDCFVGVLAMAIGYGYAVKDAAQIAFEAGVMYVEQTGIFAKEKI